MHFQNKYRTNTCSDERIDTEIPDWKWNCEKTIRKRREIFAALQQLAPLQIDPGKKSNGFSGLSLKHQKNFGLFILITYFLFPGKERAAVHRFYFGEYVNLIIKECAVYLLIIIQT